MKTNQKQAVPSVQSVPPSDACALCGLSADQIAQKIRHARRILARQRDRTRVAHAIATIRHGCDLFAALDNPQSPIHNSQFPGGAQ